MVLDAVPVIAVAFTGTLLIASRGKHQRPLEGTLAGTELGRPLAHPHFGGWNMGIFLLTGIGAPGINLTKPCSHRSWRLMDPLIAIGNGPL